MTDLIYPYRWRVRGFYGKHAGPRKAEGTLAIEVGHDTDVGKDVEVSILAKRSDIGRVEVDRIRD